MRIQWVSNQIFLTLKHIGKQVQSPHGLMQEQPPSNGEDSISCTDPPGLADQLTSLLALALHRGEPTIE